MKNPRRGSSDSFHVRSFIVGLLSSLILIMLFINVVWRPKITQPESPSPQQQIAHLNNKQPTIQPPSPSCPACPACPPIPECNTQIVVPSPPQNCMSSSSRLWPENRVITFSIYILQGRDPQWLLYGILQNFDQVKIFYPSWKMRVYHNKDVHPGFVEYFESLGIEMVPKDFNPQTPTMGMFWRFLAADDPTVDRFIVRDLDSRFSLRELHAVNEWIASGKSFHAMRDNPAHGVPILGGMWGGTRDMLKPHGVTMQQLEDEWPWKAEKGRDQEFLAAKVWPLVKKDAIVHDSEVHRGFCSEVPCRPWPTHYKNPDPTFVGQTIDHDKTVRCPCSLTLFEPDTVPTMLETEAAIKDGSWVSKKSK